MCIEAKSSHESRKRYRGSWVKTERERGRISGRRKPQPTKHVRATKTGKKGGGDLRDAASSWGLMNDGRSATTTLKLSG